MKVVNHIRHLIREMIQGVLESERGGEIKVVADEKKDKIILTRRGKMTTGAIMHSCTGGPEFREGVRR